MIRLVVVAKWWGLDVRINALARVARGLLGKGLEEARSRVLLVAQEAQIRNDLFPM